MKILSTRSRITSQFYFLLLNKMYTIYSLIAGTFSIINAFSNVLQVIYIIFSFIFSFSGNHSAGTVRKTNVRDSNWTIMLQACNFPRISWLPLFYSQFHHSKLKNTIQTHWNFVTSSFFWWSYSCMPDVNPVRTWTNFEEKKICKVQPSKL